MTAWRAALAPLLILGLLAAAPFLGLGAGWAMTLLARGMILAMAALSLWLLVGGVGLVSLGHAAMLGVGAYAVVILDAAGVTEALVVAPVAIAAAALFALVTGAVAVRTAGVHFIMITLAFGQMAFFTASSLAVYGGDDGYTLYARSTLAGTRVLEDRLAFHYLCLALLALIWLLCHVLLASRFGRVLRAARENPLRVQALGFAPYPYRLLAYAIAGGIGGLAGMLLANATEFVAPSFIAWQR
ncbi:MAG: branched-chain amino acid ABC transporter permease, partial [Acetobacteraceae bacterium]|nr:branched-chain amino acid ABC transporter permease [Acetobacteraceae bacterium]